MSRFCIKVDYDLCQGHGVCQATAPELFRLVDSDGPYPQVQVLIEEPPDELLSKAEEAVKFCPNGTLSLIRR